MQVTIGYWDRAPPVRMVGAMGLMMMMMGGWSARMAHGQSTLVGEWAWLNGSNSVNSYGSYGSLGVAAVGNVPGARRGHSMVIDSASRAMYVMGGYGYGASVSVGKT